MTALFRFADHTLVRNDRMMILTPHQATVLGMLAKAQPRVVSFERLCTGLWPMEADQPDDFHNQIAVAVHMLRPKLKPFDLEIRNVRGTGYYLIGELSMDWTSI